MKFQIKKRLFRSPVVEVIFDPIGLSALREDLKMVAPDKFTYKLVKDLPFLKAGTLLTYHEDHYGMVTSEPKKFLRDFELHYLEWFMKEVHESPSEYRDFIKLT